MNTKELQTISKKIKGNINKVIIGKESQIDLLLSAIICGGHVLLEDTPGTGKTMLAKTLALSIDAQFNRVQFTPDLLPSDLTGLNIFNQKTNEFTFISGPVFTNILLADEINRATPRTQSSLLEAMEEIQVTTDGKTRKLSNPFLVIATENPIETAGTYPLPEAQLDRFLLKLSMGFPNKNEELEIINRFISSNPLETISPVCSKEDILKMREFAKTVYMDKCIQEYILEIINSTRTDSSVSLGVSPRGTLALVKCAQAFALINGRDYVTPEDIKELAVPVLAHRIITFSGFQKSSSGISIIEKIISSIPAPTENFQSEKK